MFDSSTDDSVVRSRIRRELPADLFRRVPERILIVLPLVGAIVLLSVIVAFGPLPWFVNLLASVMIGNTYAALMFFAHEVGHGAVVKSRRIQDVVLYLACGIFCFSPHLWRVWHNSAHHSHANDPGRDPDHFGTLENFLAQRPKRRAFSKLAPGMSLLGVPYLFVFFSLQAQHVLWSKSRDHADFKRLRRGRAKLDTVVMIGFWILLACLLGPRSAFYVIVIPFLVANAVVLSYVLTNHLLMPLADSPDTLATTMSVTTLRLIDRLHFHFSHHVEHHLFPGVPSCRYGFIRSYLKANYPAEYVAPAHWRALCAIFASPRIYETHDALCDPYTERRMELSALHRNWLAADGVRDSRSRLNGRETPGQEITQPSGASRPF